MPIQIVIASNSADFRQNIKAVLESNPDLEVCGGAAALDELPAILHELKPDLVLLESSLVETGREFEPHVVQFQGHEVRIVSVRRLDDDSLEITGSGGEPIKVNNLALEQLADTQLMLAMKLGINLRIENQKLNTKNMLDETLTKKELEVLKLVAEGKTNRNIAEILVISERTVDFHLSNIMLKFGCSNRTQAVVEAFKKGIITL